MSQQLKSKGEVVGSREYFTACNRKVSLDKLLSNSNPYAYPELLKELGARAESALSAVCKDCKNLAQYLRYFPENERRQMIRMVEGLEKLILQTGSRSWTASSLLDLLKLSASETRSFSSASESDIRYAAEDVVRGKYTNSSTQMELLKKSIDHDILEVRDEMEARFLENICTGKHKDILKDILTRAHYENNKSSMRGWCGYPLFSDRYLEWVEETAFGKSLKRDVGSNLDYTQYFSSKLTAIRDELQRDLEQGIRDNDYITDLCKDNLLRAVENLEKCGISCYDLKRKIESLAWFVGGDPQKIAELQRKLNFLHLTGQLKEDGVYGAKTHEALCEFLEKIQSPNAPKLVKIGDVMDMTFSLSKDSFDAINTAREQIVEANKNIAIFHVEKGYYRDMLPVKLSASGQYRSLNGLTVSGDAARMLSVLDDSARVFEKAGKKFVVTERIFNVLELGNSVYKDITDPGKIPLTHTLKTGSKIALSSATSALFVETGIVATSLVYMKVFGAAGTAIAPGAGTIVGVILGGVLYALVGDALVNNAIDGVFQLFE